MRSASGGQITRRKETLKPTTIRDFSGGLNVIDSELNLNSRFSVILRNMFLGSDGSLQVRYGTEIFAQLGNGREIINMSYYRRFLIAVCDDGTIWANDSAGNSVVIWDDSQAQTLPNAPNAWGTLDFVTFAQFKGFLLATNGIDKPVIVDENLRVDYLNDLGTGSNVNTPIGRLITRHQDYVIIAGDPLAPGVLHISARGTSGTYLGDPDPNDAVDFDLSAFVNEGTPDIRAISSFRDKLTVQFSSTTLIVTLGTYDADGNHTPLVEDTIAEHGSLGQRVLQDLGDDFLGADRAGVSAISRALFTGSIQPERLSQLVDPSIQRALGNLSELALQNNTFAIYERLDGIYMLFAPTDSDWDVAWQTKGFAFRYVPKLKLKAWSEFTHWKWRCAARSQDGRIFFARDDKIYRYGSSQEPLYADYMGEVEEFSDGTYFTDNTGWTPVVSFAQSGLGIPFTWELPWADFDQRMLSKMLKYLKLDVIGRGRFTVETFIDNTYEDREFTGQEFLDDTLFDDGFGFVTDDPPLLPELSMEFVGGDALGFGSDFGQYFGSGRTTREELLYAWTTKANLVKMRVSGRSREPLRFVSLSLLYQNGTIRR